MQPKVDARLVPDAVDLAKDALNVGVAELAIDVGDVGGLQDVDAQGNDDELIARDGLGGGRIDRESGGAGSNDDQEDGNEDRSEQDVSPVKRGRNLAAPTQAGDQDGDAIRKLYCAQIVATSVGGIFFAPLGLVSEG